MAKPLAYIAGTGAIGPFGKGIPALGIALQSGQSCLEQVTIGNRKYPAGVLTQTVEDEISKLNILSRKSDKSVRLAYFAALECVSEYPNISSAKTGISFGTSRGPTRNWEQSFLDFNNQKPLSPFTSPITTPGVLSSEIAAALHLTGPDLTVSMTCSSSLASILNGLAWLQAGWCDYFLAGGSEAALTPFTLAQAEALHLYSHLSDSEWPCRPLDFSKSTNTMVLSEASAAILLSKQPESEDQPYISGFGTAREELSSPAGISITGEAFRNSMQQALQFSPGPVEVILVHAPGTINGDRAELKAIEGIFSQNEFPMLYPLKAITGHSYGAAGALAIVAGIKMMSQESVLPNYLHSDINKKRIRKPKRILVNAAGFGGQCISILLERN